MSGIPNKPIKPKMPKMGGSKVPSNAIPLGKNQMPPGNGQVIQGPKGGRYYVPVPGEKVQQPQPQTGTAGVQQPQQMPGQIPQQTPQQVTQPVPQQVQQPQFTAEQAKQLYPNLPNPEKLKGALPEGVSWFDIKDAYNHLLNAKKLINQYADEIQQKYPGKYDELNGLANKLLEQSANLFGLENILSVGKPSRVKPVTEEQKMKRQMGQFKTKQQYEEFKQQQESEKERQRAEASYSIETKSINIPTPKFNLTVNDKKSISKYHKQQVNIEVKDIAKKINELLKSRDLHTKIVKMPKSTDFGYRFTVKIDKRDILNKKVGRLLGVVERDMSAYTNKNLKITRDGSNIVIDMPSKEPAFVDFSSQYKELSPEQKVRPVVSLGKTMDGDNINVDIGKSTHWLITGSTGSGKSVMQNNLVGSLATKNPNDVRIMLVDPKQGNEFNQWENLPHLVGKVATTPALGLAAIKNALKEAKDRQTLFGKDRNIKTYNDKNPDKKVPHLYVFVDEFKEMLEMMGDKGFKKLVDRVAATGRSSGIHLVLGTQYGSAQTLSSGLINNLPNRVMFNMPADIVSKNSFLKESGVDRLGEPGNFALRTQTSPTTKKGRGPFISDKNINEINNSWGKTKNKSICILPIEKVLNLPISRS